MDEIMGHIMDEIMGTIMNKIIRDIIIQDLHGSRLIDKKFTYFLLAPFQCLEYLAFTSLLVSDVLDNFCLANIKCVKPQCMSTSVLSSSSPPNSNLKEVDLKGFHRVLEKNVFGVRSAC